MESPVGGSSVSERSAVGRSRTPQHASSSSLASPSQASDGDVGQPDVAGSTSPSTARRFPGLELERGMRGVDVGPRSAYRHHVAGTTLPPPVDVALHESSELLAQWAHLVPDEAFEKYLQMDDLDSLLFGCSGVVDQCPHEFANSLGSELTPETSETPSGHELGSTRGHDQVADVGTSTVGSPGKRKCREGAGDREQYSIDDIPAVVARGPRRPDKSTRYAIQTRSDVDVVEDGYRWRKYGQKPVKNSAHPRNYYRCTTPNCPVRKQVERCTENPRNVLTTYHGTHSHPGSSSHSAREYFITPVLNAEETTLKSSSAPTSLFGPHPVPSNYIPPTLFDRMVTSAFLEPWPNPAAEASDLLKMHQFFLLQYQAQYPLLTNMLNMMRNPRPPLMLDPSLALLAAQNYGMRRQANLSSLPNPTVDQQASRSTPLSMAQQRLLRMQELMNQNREEGLGEP